MSGMSWSWGTVCEIHPRREKLRQFKFVDMRRKILRLQINTSQSTGHAYNLRSLSGQRESRKKRSEIMGNVAIVQNNGETSSASNTKTGQITSFFPVRKRINTEHQIPFAREKKPVLDDSQLVPDCTSGNKENDSWQLINAVQTVPRAKKYTSIGFFQLFARETLHALFDRIPALQLASLILASKTLNTEIRAYVMLGDARRRFAAETMGYVFQRDFQSAQDPFYAWGLLLKAATIIMSLRSRHAFLASFFIKNEGVTNWCGWGRCFMAFSRNWKHGEREELFREIMQFSTLNDYLSLVMPSGYGQYPQIEIEIRERLRGFFLSQFSENHADYVFWHTVILRAQKNATEQGKLLQILYGPSAVNENGYRYISWELLTNFVLETHLGCEEIIGPISNIIYCLATSGGLVKYKWNSEQIFTLIEEVTTIPRPWMFHNFAALLALQPELVNISLYNRILCSYEDEAAQIFYATVVVLHRWGLSCAPLNNVMLKTFLQLSGILRRIFLTSLLRKEAEHMANVLQFVPFNGDHFQMEAMILRDIHSLITLLTPFV